MRITKIVCNRCGKEIKEHPVQIVPVLTDRESGDILPEDAGDAPQEKEQQSKDYCKDCVIKIMAFANGMVENPDFKKAVEAAEKKAKPKEECKTRNRIDMGKMLALQKAGWPVKKIADELKVTDKAIYNALSRVPKEEKNLVEG